jgi:hypothetical protein
MMVMIFFILPIYNNSFKAATNVWLTIIVSRRTLPPCFNM